MTSSVSGLDSCDERVEVWSEESGSVYFNSESEMPALASSESGSLSDSGNSKTWTFGGGIV